MLGGDAAEVTGMGLNAKRIIITQTYIFFDVDHAKRNPKEEKTDEITKCLLE